MPEPQMLEASSLPPLHLVEAEIKNVNTRTAGVVTKADKLVVRDQESQLEATNYLVVMSKARKAADESRKEFSGPFDKAAKAINRVFYPIIDRLEAAERSLKNRVGAYVQKLERQREHELEKQRAEERKATAAGVDVVPKPPPVHVERKVATAGGTASATKVWTFTVVDKKKVPDRFKLVDERAVRAHMKMGVSIGGKPEPVNGIEFKEEMDVRVRTR